MITDKQLELLGSIGGDVTTLVESYRELRRAAQAQAPLKPVLPKGESHALIIDCSGSMNMAKNEIIKHAESIQAGIAERNRSTNYQGGHSTLRIYGFREEVAFEVSSVDALKCMRLEGPASFDGLHKAITAALKPTLDGLIVLHVITDGIL
jgi:hypothetical protein